MLSLLYIPLTTWYSFPFELSCTCLVLLWFFILGGVFSFFDWWKHYLFFFFRFDIGSHWLQYMGCLYCSSSKAHNNTNETEANTWNDGNGKKHTTRWKNKRTAHNNGTLGKRSRWVECVSVCRVHPLLFWVLSLYHLKI